ncbi:hypothetical protein [Photobacterium sp. R1]
MIVLIPNQNISTKGVKLLRSLTSKSIAQIRESALNMQPLETYEVFDGDWDNVKKKLITLAQKYDESIFVILEVQGDEYSPFTLDGFLEYLKEIRSIEINQQKISDLECGYIAVESEFIEHNENWYSKV